MNSISNELRQFLVEWYVHTTEKEQTLPFKNHAGLCANAQQCNIQRIEWIEKKLNILR